MALLLSLAAGPLPASSLERDAEILIHSQPEGAAVMALGKTWGVTPMRLRVRDAFPALYRPEQPYIGMAIHLSKEGCSEYRFPVHRRSIPTEIHAELACAPAAQATTPAGTTAAEPVPPAQPPAAAAPKGVRAKLEELEQLRRDGLVSEEEYQRLRTRVLEYF
jgi:hypothetical protein